MAQSVNLWGATYSDVPAIEVPKSGGGMASFTDVTDTTAAASDVATGKYFYTAAGVRTQGTGTGGIDGDNLEYGILASNVVGYAIVGTAVLGSENMVGTTTVGSAIVGG